MLWMVRCSCSSISRTEKSGLVGLTCSTSIIESAGLGGLGGGRVNRGVEGSVNVWGTSIMLSAGLDGLGCCLDVLGAEGRTKVCSTSIMLSEGLDGRGSSFSKSVLLEVLDVWGCGCAK